ncbi:MAG: amidohydrolase family protein [Gemmatimonadetes bacterium]|nr:amidohydrolase family protein [Gemmatimonadota bacterium]
MLRPSASDRGGLHHGIAAATAAAAVAVGVLAAPPLAAQSAEVVALVGGTVIDGTGAAPLVDGVVVVDGDRIVCAGSRDACAVPDDAEVVDVSGRYVTPGLVDAHVHFSQTGWLDGRPDGLTAEEYPYDETAEALEAEPERWAQSYLCSGITAVFDVGGHPWTTRLPARFEDDPTAVHVRAAGPLITHARVPALQVDDEVYTFLPMGSADEARESARRVAEMGAGAVKVWYLGVGPERAPAMDAALAAVGEEARAAGLDLIVHATGLREAKAALRAGAFLLVHSVEDQFVDDEFLEMLVAGETIYAPTLTVGANWSRAISSVVLDRAAGIDDPNGCVDADTREKVAATTMLRDDMNSRLLDDAEYVYRRMRAAGRSEAIMAENLRRVHEAGGVIATATDAGNPMTLHGPSIYAELEAMQAAGLTPSEVITLSTLNGARAMRREADFGTLAGGKIADLLVLGQDPTQDVRAFRTVEHVMRAGELHSMAELAAAAGRR